MAALPPEEAPLGGERVRAARGPHELGADVQRDEPDRGATERHWSHKDSADKVAGMQIVSLDANRQNPSLIVRGSAFGECRHVEKVHICRFLDIAEACPRLHRHRFPRLRK